MWWLGQTLHIFRLRIQLVSDWRVGFQAIYFVYIYMQSCTSATASFLFYPMVVIICSDDKVDQDVVIYQHQF